jgi:hypothetical protein
MNILLRAITIIGNVAFIFWIIKSGVNAGFAGTVGQLTSYGSLVILLTLNTSLLLNK